MLPIKSCVSGRATAPDVQEPCHLRGSRPLGGSGGAGDIRVEAVGGILHEYDATTGHTSGTPAEGIGAATWPGPPVGKWRERCVLRRGGRCGPDNVFPVGR